MRRVVLLSVCLATCGVIATAAPVPKPSEREQFEKLWGKIVAGSDECEFKLTRGGGLLLRGNGKPALRPSDVPLLLPQFEGMTPSALRVVRTATGDFDYRVRLSAVTAPDREASSAVGRPETQAGVFVSGGECAVELHAWLAYDKRKGKLNEQCTRSIWLDEWLEPGTGNGSRVAKYEQESDLCIGISRVEGKCFTHISTDGKKWSKYPVRNTLQLPDEVQLGVFLSHTTQQKVQAEFTRVTAPKDD